MNKSGIAIILLCFLAAAAVVLWERRKVIKTMEEIERMLDVAMIGSFSETTFDESQLSALETKFAHYLSAADEPTGNLDSKTSQDVLSLLKVTSQKFAQTIVMITHNEEIAQMADRIIRIEDGRIVSEN